LQLAGWAIHPWATYGETKGKEMAFHCRCGVDEPECQYPKCHNGERDKSEEGDLVVGVLSGVAKDLVAEHARHDKESLFRALNRLFPKATADEIDAAISAAL
jgi:hypothetical protein